MKPFITALAICSALLMSAEAFRWLHRPVALTLCLLAACGFVLLARKVNGWTL